MIKITLLYLIVVQILVNQSKCLDLINSDHNSFRHLEASRLQHDFYALEKTTIVSNSISIKGMDECKKQCLAMGKNFPFHFMYHRYILRQKVGNGKYFQGTCHFALKTGNSTVWYPWSKMKIFIVDTQLFPNLYELQIWTNYQKKCEDTTLKLNKNTLKALGYTMVHSNFQYFDNGAFKNLQPFTDINKMLADLGGLITL